MDKLKLKSLKAGDVVAWNVVNPRYHIVRTAVVERVTGKNIWTPGGDVLWAPDLRGLRIASEDDLREAR